MGISAGAKATVHASSQEVLEFVLDLHRYQQLDSKMLRVSAVTEPGEDGVGTLKMWGKLPWMPPAPDQHDILLDRWQLLTFTGARGTPARLVFDFIGRFHCAPLDARATAVTHSYEFRFRGPFKLVEARLEPWLQSDVEREVAELVDIFAPHRQD